VSVKSDRERVRSGQKTPSENLNEGKPNDEGQKDDKEWAGCTLKNMGKRARGFYYKGDRRKTTLASREPPRPRVESGEARRHQGTEVGRRGQGPDSVIGKAKYDEQSA